MAKAATPSETQRAVPRGSALGMVETFGLAAAIEAADAMLKSAEVTLVRQQRTVPAMVTHFVMGETAAVQAAVDSGAAAAARVGRVVGSHVIPRPSPDVWKRLVGMDPDAWEEPASPVVARTTKSSVAAPKEKAAPKKPVAGVASAGDYDTMTVRALRSAARDRDDERLTGRAIASSSKGELIDFLRASDAGK